MKWSSFKYLVGQGLHSLRMNRLMTLASVGVLSVCLILTGVAYLFSANVDSVVEYIGQQNEMVVYLDPDLSEEEISQVDSAVRSVSGVTSITYVSKADVLTTYKGYMEEYASLWDAFEDDNPFKANYRVVVEDLEQMEALSAQFAAIPGVVKVSAPLELSDIFISVQRVVTYAGYTLVAVLALVSVVVISNTIRLTLFARRKEINIMKYVGATNGFIRLPFFVEGVASGLISAAIASVVVLGSYYALEYYSTQLFTGMWATVVDASLVPLADVWYWLVAGFCAFAFVLGGLGTATSIRKQLNV